MKNFCIILALLCMSVILTSCDDGVKFNNPNDQNADITDSSDSQNDEDKDSADTESADEDSKSSENNDNDSDTAPEQGDSDNDADTTPDESDSTPDEDADADSGDSTPDTDTTPADPCNPNPCTSVANSNKECSVFGGTTYKCGCNSGYYWDGSTCGTTQTQAVACTGLEENSEWNIVSEVIQTWDEYLAQWVPSHEGVYNEEPSTNRCRFKCKEHYNRQNSKCVADKKTADCITEIPENAVWNGVTSITQTWNGTESDWLPSTSPRFSETACEENCCFKCDGQHFWDGSDCQLCSCDGKMCGDDGCGHECGEGCGDDEVCVESTHTCKSCTTVTLSPVAESVNNNGYIYFRTTSNAYTPNTGDTTQDDKYILTFKSGAAMSGLDLSTSIEHCDGKQALDNQFLCFSIIEDHKVSDDPKRFLPKSGTIRVNSVNNGSSFTGNGAKINANISGVKMYEMIEYIDNSGIIAKTKYEFIPGGDCIIVNDTTLIYE